MLLVLGFLLLIWGGFRPRGESLFPSPVSHDFLFLSFPTFFCSYGRKILVPVKQSNSIRYKKRHHLRDPQTGSCLILYLHFYKHLDMHSYEGTPKQLYFKFCWAVMEAGAFLPHGGVVSFGPPYSTTSLSPSKGSVCLHSALENAILLISGHTVCAVQGTTVRETEVSSRKCIRRE